MDDKDRDEAIKVITVYLKCPYNPTGLPKNWESMPIFVNAVEDVKEEIARIRADERRRCADIAVKYLLTQTRGNELACDGLHAAILQGTEPANKSEDAEKDIQTVFAHMLWTDRSREAGSRLVERIKE